MNRTPTRVALRLARRAVAYEMSMWRSLYRWVLRRPLTTEPGAETFGYAGATRPILLTFIVVSAIEVPGLDVILRHTGVPEPVRTAAVALGVWGLLWMIGMLAAQQVHPHIVGASGLRVRSGATIDVTVPWEAVDTITTNRRPLTSDDTVQVAGNPGRRVLSLGAANQTTVDVTLRTPRVFLLPAGPSEPVTELRLYADAPDALVARARRHLGADAHLG